MADSVLNLGAFSAAELTSMLTAAKAEYLVRMNPGRVKSGGSAAQQYSMDVMSLNQLIDLINSLTTQLGLDSDNLLVAPNFNTNPAPNVLGSTFGA